MAPHKIWLLLALLAPVSLRADTVTASWYGPGFDGKRAASGCVYRASELTAASRTLPLGTILRVERGKAAVLVVITDRGPFVRGRDIDLSRAAADWLDMTAAGVGRVRITVVGWQPLNCRRRT